MATTMLMHIKPASKGGGGRHLSNSIEYILKPSKTGNGLWVGGNCGSEAAEAYGIMMQTKRDWGKEDGRQGYHFVLSWLPGEIDRQTAYEITRKFCEEYLGDSYDYTFAIHDDKKHLHGHIVFNSVNRNDGYKYRYEPGDWEKYIQPITDRLCIEHGLPPLKYDRDNRKGRSYAQWSAEKEGKITWQKIIRSDIDYAASRSADEKDFIKRMERDGYRVRKGCSLKQGEYYSFVAPGQKRAWRSYRLGAGYSYTDICQKIGKRSAIREQIRTPHLKKSRMCRAALSLSEFQKKRVRRIYIITHRRRAFRNPYEVDQGKIRKDLLQIRRLREDCAYLLRRNIRSYEELLEREEQVHEIERRLKNEKYRQASVKEDDEIKEYQMLQKQLRSVPEGDDSFEDLLDKMEELGGSLPDGAYRELGAAEETEKDLYIIRQEKKIIRHIKKEESNRSKAPVHPRKRLEARREMTKGEQQTWAKR